MPGISTHTELELLVRLGLTPREALAAATSNYSEQFGWHELGLVEAGRRADLLILAADPTADISNTRKIHSLFLDGAVLESCCVAQCTPMRQIARCLGSWLCLSDQLPKAPSKLVLSRTPHVVGSQLCTPFSAG